jgi:hypothetical protein
MIKTGKNILCLQVAAEGMVATIATSRVVTEEEEASEALR